MMLPLRRCFGFFLIAFLAGGCELIADFDRGKIPTDAAVVPDARRPPDILEDGGIDDGDAN